MTATATLLREIETLPEEAAAQVLDFAMFIKSRHTLAQPSAAKLPLETANAPFMAMTVPSIKDAYGIFNDLKGIDTTIERDEEDRI